MSDENKEIDIKKRRMIAMVKERKLHVPSQPYHMKNVLLLQIAFGNLLLVKKLGE